MRGIAAFCSLFMTSFVMLQPATAQQPVQRATLNVASFGGQSDEIFKKAFVGFETEYNLKIQWVPGVAAENLAKVAASKANPVFDVALVENLGHMVGSKQGLWEPINESIVTNYKDLFPQAKAPNRDGAGFGYYLAGIFFNPVEFEKRGWAPPKSWNDIFRPEFCGRLGLVHPNVAYTIHTLLMLAGGNPARIDDAIAKFATLKNCVSVLEPSSPKLEEKVQLGEYLVGVHGNIRIIYLVNKGYPVKFIYPEEGTISAVSVASVVKGAANPRLAQLFVNWFIRPDVQTQIMEGLFYGPTNQKVVVSRQLKDLGVPDAELMRKMVHVDDSTMIDLRRDWVRRTERAFAN